MIKYRKRIFVRRYYPDIRITGSCKMMVLTFRVGLKILDTKNDNLNGGKIDTYFVNPLLRTGTV
jgi:hypothetical protein